MGKEIKLSPPWVTYYRELEELFSQDPEVTVKFDEDKLQIKLLVANTDKAYALSMLLNPSKEFGNVTVTINVIPSNDGEKSSSELMQMAFKGNPVCSQIKAVTDFTGNKVDYVAFKSEVAQFFNDDISDLNGNKSMLYKEIAEDVFKEHDGIFFCTDEKFKHTYW